MAILIALPTLIVHLDTATATRYFVIASLVVTAVMLCASLVLLRTVGRKDYQQEDLEQFKYRTPQLPPEPDIYPEQEQEQLLEKAN